MKSFRKILSEVAQPKSEDELNFKDKHEVDAIDHPESEEHQHVAHDKYKRSGKRIADYDEGEDEAVYEGLDPVGKEDDDVDNDGDVDDSDEYLHKRRKAISKAIKEATKAPATNHSTYEDYVKANKNKGVQVMPKSLWTKLKNESVDIGEEAQPKWKVQIGKKHYTVTGRNTAEANRKAAALAKKDGNMGVGGSIERISESAEQLDELSPNTLHRYIKKATGDVVARTTSAVASKPTDQTRKHASKLGKRIAGISSASGRLADKANSSMYEEITDKDTVLVHSHKMGKDMGKYGVFNIEKVSSTHISANDHNTGKTMKFNRKTNCGIGDHDQLMIKKIMTAELSEISKKTLGSYVKKATSQLDKDWDDTKAGKPGMSTKKVMNRFDGVYKARAKGANESVELEENFKVGALKLNDGSSVIVKKQDADLLNQMFKDLNSSNKKKMEKVLMTDKAGFEEILGFAREAM